MHGCEELDESFVAEAVLADVEVFQGLVCGDHFRELIHVALAETVMLHGKLLQALIEVDHVHKLADGIAREQVPGDVQEL